MKEEDLAIWFRAYLAALPAVIHENKNAIGPLSLSRHDCELHASAALAAYQAKRDGL